MSTIKECIMRSIEQSDDAAFIRREFEPFGSRSGVTRALREIVDEGRLLRYGIGIYFPAKEGKRYGVRESDAVLTALTKLGYEPTWGGWLYRLNASGRTTQMPWRPTVTVNRPSRLRLGRGRAPNGGRYWLEERQWSLKMEKWSRGELEGPPPTNPNGDQ